MKNLGLLGLVLSSVLLLGSVSQACNEDLTRNIRDNCETIRVNFVNVSQAVREMGIDGMTAILSDSNALESQYGIVDSCELYKKDSLKYGKYMDIKALSSGALKLIKGSSLSELNPREVMVLAGVLDSKMNVQSAINCRR